jgi:hypothetical protein
MAQKITVALEDDLDGGPADETVRFGVDGAAYEIDLSTKNAAALRRQLARSSIMPARPGGDGAAGRRGPQPAGTAAGASGHGRNRPASRSATAGASPPASLSSTKPPPKDADTSSRIEDVRSAHFHARASIIIRRW